MAKDDELQQNSDAKARVYKSKDVHRRRADRKALNEKGAHSSLPEPGEFSQSESPDQSGDEGVQATALPVHDRAQRGRNVLAALSPSEKRKLRKASGSAEGDAGALESAASENKPSPKTTSDQSDCVGGAPEIDSAGGAYEASGGEEPAAADEADVKADAGADANAGENAGDDDGDGADGVDAQDQPAPSQRRKATLAKRIIGGIVLVVVLVAVGVGAYFAWDRWGRYDDHADMQGEWYVAGTTVPLSIDAKSIHLTDDLSYEYEIDDHGKTIHFTFGPMEGQGRYWFSGDRRFLAITDGEGFNGAGTAFEDVMHAFKDLSSGDVITGTQLPEGEGVIVFCREPGKLVTMVKEAAERAKERAKKQAEREKEEAERKAAAQEAAEAEAEARALEAQAAAGSVDYSYYDDGSADYAYDEGYVDDAADVGYDEAHDETYVESYDDGTGGADGTAEGSE